MRKDLVKLSTALLIVTTLVGCGGNSNVNRNNINQSGDIDNNIYNLTPQSTTQSKLFYGNSKHNALGSLSNVQIIDTNGTKRVFRKSIDVKYPVMTTAFRADKNGSYTNFHIQSISYISDSKPYIVSMTKDSTEVANSSVGVLTDKKFSYQKIDYFGGKQYLVSTNKDGNQVLITP
ncbi:MAG: hypothetical protein KAU90_09355, partial [Sulfurovaceae bacterium]|nr:hypothetical protein [Sulfurovaceae bacterium]